MLKQLGHRQSSVRQLLVKKIARPGSRVAVGTSSFNTQWFPFVAASWETSSFFTSVSACSDLQTSCAPFEAPFEDSHIADSSFTFLTSPFACAPSLWPSVRSEGTCFCVPFPVWGTCRCQSKHLQIHSLVKKNVPSWEVQVNVEQILIPDIFTPSLFTTGSIPVVGADIGATTYLWYFDTNEHLGTQAGHINSSNVGSPSSSLGTWSMIISALEFCRVGCVPPYMTKAAPYKFAYCIDTCQSKVCRSKSLYLTFHVQFQ